MGITQNITAVVIFLIVFALVSPILSRGVKLGFAAWDNREYIQAEQLKSAILRAFLSIIISLVIVFAAVNFLYNLLV